MRRGRLPMQCALWPSDQNTPRSHLLINARMRGEARPRRRQPRHNISTRGVSVRHDFIRPSDCQPATLPELPPSRRRWGRLIVSLGLIGLAVSIALVMGSAAAIADGRVFPPDDCSAASPVMAFNG